MGDVRDAIERLYDLSDPLDPVDDGDIAAFEAEIGARLPNDYRTFLLLHNGGRLHINRTFKDLSLEVLFGLGKGEEKWPGELRWNREFYREIAEDWLMFGEVAGLNNFCLSLRKEDYGSVWVWDPDDWLPLYKTMTCLNCTFLDLLSQLQRDEGLYEARKTAASPEPLRSILRYDLPDSSVTLRRMALLTVATWPTGSGTRRMIAAACWPNVVPLLLQHGADVEARDSDGQTPLFSAASARSIDSVRALLRYGADPLAEDDPKVDSALQSLRTRDAEGRGTVFTMRAQLEGRGITVDYGLLESIVAAGERNEAEEAEAIEEYLGERVFFWNNGGGSYPRIGDRRDF